MLNPGTLNKLRPVSKTTDEKQGAEAGYNSGLFAVSDSCQAKTTVLSFCEENYVFLMKWDIKFDKANGFIRANQSGSFCLEEQSAFLSEIVNSPDWLHGIPLLIDFCELSVENIFYNEVSSVSGQIFSLKEKLGPGKIALLCADETQFGLGRQFQIMAEIDLGREIRVYRDESSAITFLTREQAVS